MNIKNVRFFLLAGVAVCFISTPSFANEEARDLAIGIGAGLLMKGIEALSNNSSESSEASGSSSELVKPKLAYDEKVAQMQSALKELCYYNGSIDGLKGQNTLNAMHQWQKDNNLNQIDKVSDIDLDIITDQVDARKQSVEVDSIPIETK